MRSVLENLMSQTKKKRNFLSCSYLCRDISLVEIKFDRINTAARNRIVKKTNRESVPGYHQKSNLP